MESFLILCSIAFALVLGAVSPGPAFIYVAKNSIAVSRKHGLFTALGGSIIWIISGIGFTSYFIGCAIRIFNSKNMWWYIFALACL